MHAPNLLAHTHTHTHKLTDERPPAYLAASLAIKRSILAELARRLLELAGWLSGRVEDRRLRRFERAYFTLRRWHLGLGEAGRAGAGFGAWVRL